MLQKCAKKLPKSRKIDVQGNKKRHPTFDSIFEAIFDQIWVDFETPQTLKIVLPCRRERDFKNIAMFAANIDFDQKMGSFWEPKTTKNSPKSGPRRVRRPTWSEFGRTRAEDNRRPAKKHRQRGTGTRKKVTKGPRSPRGHRVRWSIGGRRGGKEGFPLRVR